MKCNHCNAEVENGSKFCYNCGNSIIQQQIKTCTKCRTEVEEGENFCSNCGTPLYELRDVQVQQQAMDEYSEHEIIKGKTAINEDVTVPTETAKMPNGIGKIAMWSTIAAIVMYFVVSGLGFSFWLYLFIIFMAFIALIIYITISGSMKDIDAWLAKIAYVVCFVCIGLLLKCGPLNSDYANKSEDINVAVNTNDYTPSWIEGKWAAVLFGGETIIILNNGRAHMEIVENKITRTETIVSHEGSYYIRGNYVYLSFLNGMSVVLEMDEKRQLLYGKGGSIFRKR